MLISTWDGDELSLIRAHEHLRVGHRLVLDSTIAALDDLVHEAAARLGAGVRIGGLGLYRTLSFPDAARVHDKCRAGGLLLGRGLPDTLTLVPALDIDPAALRGPIRTQLLDSLVSLGR
jgi:hypothetical protein